MWNERVTFNKKMFSSLELLNPLILIRKSSIFLYGKKQHPLVHLNIQLFRERLSEKVHATMPKGIVGGFEFTVLQRKLQEWH